VTPREASVRIPRDLRVRLRGTKKQILEAALLGAEVIAKRAPKDIGQLKSSIRAVPTAAGARIVLDAPHAGIMELGSRPHFPPLQPLIDWVRRHVGHVAKDLGVRTPHAPKSTRTKRGAALMARYVDYEREIVAVARAIQRKIGRKGTKPRYFVKKSLPDLVKIFARILAKAEGGVLRE